jgi:hypothetical protein
MRKIKFIATIIFSSILSQSYAQDYVKIPAKPIEEISLEKSVTVLPLLLPGINHEIRLNRLQSLHLNLGTGLTISATPGTNNGVNTSIYLIPTVDFRHYYNLEKRVVNNRNITRNSGNFLALRVRHRFPPISGTGIYPYDRNATQLGGVWGIQRNYLSGFYLGLSLGPGITFDRTGNYLSGIGEFQIGIQLGSRKD